MRFGPRTFANNLRQGISVPISMWAWSKSGLGPSGLKVTQDGCSLRPIRLPMSHETMRAIGPRV